jgi:hypothetical protein
MTDPDAETVASRFQELQLLRQLALTGNAAAVVTQLERWPDEALRTHPEGGALLVESLSLTAPSRSPSCAAGTWTPWRRHA